MLVCRPGETLFEAGDVAGRGVLPGERAARGRRSTAPRSGCSGPGAVIGELALLTSGTRSATVRARRDSVLLRLAAGRRSSPVMERHPGAGGAVARVLADQLAPARVPAPGDAEGSRTVAVVGSAPPAHRRPSVADALTTCPREARLGRRPRRGWTAPGSARAEQGARRRAPAGRRGEPDGDPGWWAAPYARPTGVVAVATTALAARGRPAGPAGGVRPGPGRDRRARRPARRLGRPPWTPGRSPCVAEVSAVVAARAGRPDRRPLPGPRARRGRRPRPGPRAACWPRWRRPTYPSTGSPGAASAASWPACTPAGCRRRRVGGGPVRRVRARASRSPTTPFRRAVPGQGTARAGRAGPRRSATRTHRGPARASSAASAPTCSRGTSHVHRRGSVVDALRWRPRRCPGCSPPVRSSTAGCSSTAGVLANLPRRSPARARRGSRGGGQRRAWAAVGRLHVAGPVPATAGAAALGETLLRTMLIGSGGATADATAAGAGRRDPAGARAWGSSSSTSSTRCTTRGWPPAAGSSPGAACPSEAGSPAKG